MRDLGLREIAGRYLGLEGEFYVIRDILGEPQVPDPRSLREKLEDIVYGPFNIVVLGDSVGWGQGLKTEDKYASQIQRSLVGELQPQQVNVSHIFAHSGARIQPGDDRTQYPGEVPVGEPTVETQVTIAAEGLQRASVDPRYAVDLVLVAAGINNVSIFNILSSDPTVGPEWVRKL